MRSRPCIYLIVTPDTCFERGVYQGVYDFLLEKFPQIELFTVSVPVAIDTKRSIKGIIAMATRMDERDMLFNYGVPVVNVSGYLESVNLPTVTCDNEMAGRMAAEYLINCRFQHFGYHQHIQGHSVAVRYKSFKNALMAAGFQCSHHEHYKYTVDGTLDLDVEQQQNLKKWLSGLPKPVAIFCATDRDAWEVWSMCNALNLQIGKDVGILGHGNEQFYCETRHPYLSSVEICTDRVGHEAAALLFRLIRGATPPAHPILIAPTGVIARESADIFQVEDEYVDMAIQFIRKNLETPNLIQQVFKHVPISQRVLERRFNKYLNRTLVETIQELRVERAKYLLDTTAMKIYEIAHACGFSNIFYMTRVFSKKAGLSPTRYRIRFKSERIKVPVRKS